MSAVLIAGGFLLVVLSFFPISMAEWLPRAIQLLIGFLAVLTGVVLVEVKGMVER